jgi:hypothetical protein
MVYSPVSRANVSPKLHAMHVLFSHKVRKLGNIVSKHKMSLADMENDLDLGRAHKKTCRGHIRWENEQIL